MLSPQSPGKKSRGSRLSAACMAVAGLLLAGCNWLVETQVFFPETSLDRTPEVVGLSHEDVWFTSADGIKLSGWLINSEGAEHLVLFCHGNAGNISHRLDNLKLLHELRLSVFIFDYRGYGRSHGRISEPGFYLDAEAAAALARGYAERFGLKLVIFGRSLGGIAAVHAAVTGTCAGVILESTFPNLGSVARVHYPLPLVERWLRKRFDAESEIRQLRRPVLFIHGDQDTIVPLRLGQRLYAAAPGPKEMVVLPGAGHNDTFLAGGGQKYQEILARFIYAL